MKHHNTFSVAAWLNQNDNLLRSKGIITDSRTNVERAFTQAQRDAQR